MVANSTTDAMVRIKEAIKSGATTLDLAGTSLGADDRLIEVPQEVFELSELTSLNLSNNTLTRLPDNFGRLTKLRSLILSGNHLTELPASLFEIEALSHLDLHENPRLKLSVKLRELRKLRHLSIGKNAYDEPPSWLGGMSQLRGLRIVSGGLSSGTRWLSNLAELENLDIQGNGLRKIPSGVYGMQKLRSLNAGDNNLIELDPRIGWLKSLEHLTLYRTGLSSLPNEISQLEKLQNLALWNNKFNEIPKSLFNLQNLEHLSFNNESTTSSTRDNNLISEIPIEIAKLPKLKELDLRGCDVRTPPPEVAAQGLEALRQYFKQLEEEGIDYLYEAKILIVGEGGAGKTSLVNKLLDPNYCLIDSEKSTEGVEVKKWRFCPSTNSKLNSFTANIWDFGGQEIYHATHQFFLTKRSVYVLVADTRKEDTDFHYWLNIVELLSSGSPVLIVKNEKQDRHRDINEQKLYHRFPCLAAVASVNLSTNRGLLELSKKIASMVSSLPHIGTPLPKNWVNIRKALESRQTNYIPLSEYFDICKEYGFSSQADKLRLSEYLHDLGVCLHFQADPILRHTMILRPKWGTDAVYRVLDNKTVIASMGSFTKNELVKIWHEPDYANMCDELLRLMLNFRLCYEIPQSQGVYIAPQLLDSTAPDYKFMETGAIVLKYEYEFMPKGIISQLIVATHKLISTPKSVWRNGAVLRKNDAEAEIIEFYENRQVRVRVCGRYRKDLLTIIMYELEKIHSAFKDLKLKTLIPCNCQKCKETPNPYSISFDTLRRFVSDGQERIQCQESYEMVDVSGLLDDVVNHDDSILEDKVERGGITFNAPIQNVIFGNNGGNINMPKVTYRSAWLNGSFYLFVFVVIFSTLAFAAKIIPVYALAMIIVAAAILVPIIGALQLRQDERLGEKTFLDLMALAMRQLPLVKKSK